MPTEQQLRDNEGEQHVVGDSVVWFEEDMFFAAPADSWDCGDGFETYEEMLASL